MHYCTYTGWANQVNSTLIQSWCCSKATRVEVTGCNSQHFSSWKYKYSIHCIQWYAVRVSIQCIQNTQA